MMVDFNQIGELALIIMMGEAIILNNGMIIDENNIGQFLTNTYDA